MRYFKTRTIVAIAISVSAPPHHARGMISDETRNAILTAFALDEAWDQQGRRHCTEASLKGSSFDLFAHSCHCRVLQYVTDKQGDYWDLTNEEKDRAATQKGKAGHSYQRPKCPGYHEPVMGKISSGFFATSKGKNGFGKKRP